MINKIAATVIILALISCGYAPAAPASSAEYTINGSQVTGSGTNTTTAFFKDTSATTYQITIVAGADLGTTSQNEVEFHDGSLTNMGTLSTSGNPGSAVYITNGGNVTNMGLITGADTGFGLGVEIGGNGSVTNSGTITGGNAAIFSQNALSTSGVASFTVNNSGNLTGSVYGINVFDTATGITGNVTINVLTNNSGSIVGTDAGIFISNYTLGDTGSSNTLTYSLKNTGMLRGSTIRELTSIWVIIKTLGQQARPVCWST